MGASTISCTSFFTVRPSSVEPRVRAMPSHGLATGKKLDGVATWLMNGLSTAFFASMDRCSCIRISTEEDSDETTDLPLILNDGNIGLDGSSSAGALSRRKASKGKKREAIKEGTTAFL